MGNNAIHDNPSSSDISITNSGSDFLWAVFSIMMLSDLILILWSFKLPHGQRAFHWCGVAILSTASVAYFAMASNLGSTPVALEYLRGASGGTTRAIWYARYCDWFVTTPLLLLTLLLGTGMSLSNIFATIFMDELMIITGLIGSLIVSRYKWGFFAFGCAALLFVIYQLVVPARTASRFIGDDVLGHYTRSAVLLSFLWFLYPIAWGLADGGNVIHSNSEMYFYGILDLIAKPVWIFLHLFAMRSVQYERFGLSSGHNSMGLLSGTNGAGGGVNGGGVNGGGVNGAGGVKRTL